MYLFFFFWWVEGVGVCYWVWGLGEVGGCWRMKPSEINLMGAHCKRRINRFFDTDTPSIKVMLVF